MSVVHPIDRAWISTGGTGAQNYDEFADDAEITAIVTANPTSALAIEMPHLVPGSLGKSFAEALPDAVTRLAAAKRDGRYTPAERVVGVYRISASGGKPSYGLFGMVDTDQISAAAGEPGVVIRNEDVFLEKVRERVALTQATGHLLSAVLLVRTDGDALHAALAQFAENAGPPAVTDVDQSGRTHAVWSVGPGPVQESLCALAGGGELVVADGNHRSLAAQLAKLPRFLAVVTTPDSVTIQPYNRLVNELTVGPHELVAQLAAAGAVVTPAGEPQVPAPGSGVVHLYCGPDASWTVRLPLDAAGERVDNLDHAVVERVLLRAVLGLDPGDKRITYVGGDYPASWLAAEVDAGRASLAVLIAPVTVDDFLAVNLARQKLPRKSTWFTPKARAGLVLADVANLAEG